MDSRNTDTIEVVIHSDSTSEKSAEDVSRTSEKSAEDVSRTSEKSTEEVVKSDLREERRGRRVMHVAALIGLWNLAERLLREDPSLARTPLTRGGDTALHTAALAKNVNFVRQLVSRLDESDMRLFNNLGYTPLAYAAIAGEVEIAEIVLDKAPRLVSHVSGDPFRNPLCRAAFAKKEEMTRFLYSKTAAKDLSGDVWSYVLLATVQNSMLDLAREILSKIKDDVSMEYIMELLQHLALNYNFPGQSTKTGFLKVIEYLPWFRWAFRRPLMQRNALLLGEMLWNQILDMDQPNLFELLVDFPILHDAARVGNVGFITMISHTDPEFIFIADRNGHSIFHIAIIERQYDVFSLIYQIGPMIELISTTQDIRGNNMLHLAAKLPHSQRLSFGAALPTQREIFWFKIVEKLVSPLCLEMKNSDDDKCPRELFSKEHHKLFEKDENWIKNISNYSMVASTLVATMAFAASITVSGGNNDETGMPIFSNRSWFRTFKVFNTIAMFSSTTSIIMFLSIYVSRYRENNFAVALPIKLMLGYLMIFISIVGTLIAFTSAFVLVNEDNNSSASRWVLVGVCAILIAVYVAGHYKYFIDTIRLAYWSKFSFHKSKYKLY